MATIDPSWEQVEGQEGLYVESYERINSFTGLPMVMRILHSADGYCFYDSSTVYYDEEGEEIPAEDVTPEMRIYYQYMAIAPAQDITVFVSVPVQDGYEIASAGGSNHETA